MKSIEPVLHVDPLLADVSELLHRMSLCNSVEPFKWMASDALRKLQQYEQKFSNGDVTL
ncbi:MAG: hypothetical protein V4801_02485 [Burkholderia gladioli]